MDPWQQIITQGILVCLMPSTKQAYERALVTFISFTSTSGWSNAWPVPEALLLHYVAHLNERALALKTMGIHLATITFCSKAQGFVDLSILSAPVGSGGLEVVISPGSVWPKAHHFTYVAVLSEYST